MNASRAAFVTLVAMFTATAAVASTVTTYDRNTFQTALASNSLSGQNFDSLPLGTITTVNGVTYKPSAGTALVTSTYLTTTNPNGLGSTSQGFFGSAETLTILFSAPVTAFALDINTYATNNGAYGLLVNDGSASLVNSIYDVFPNFSTGQFIGLTDSSAFSSVVLSSLSTTQPYTVDTLVYGNASAITSPTATPEPSSLWLLSTGVLSIAGLVRRRLA